jgi:hypothetical protein
VDKVKSSFFSYVNPGDMHLHCVYLGGSEEQHLGFNISTFLICKAN